MGIRKTVILLVMVMSLLGFVTVAFAGSLTEGWSGDIFVGYTRSDGNTEKSSASVAASALKKFEHAQYQLKATMLYSSTDNKMDGQKWDVLNRFSRDFGKDYKWYNFYQLLVDHDYFADIDYRITPSAGIGYHIANSESWVWDADVGVGYRIIRYRVNTAADDEVVTAVIHTFMKKKIFESAFLSEDLTVYPGLESGSAIVLRSETAFTNPLQENLDLEIKYIVDHNSEPAAGKEKTDTQLLIGLKYKF